MKKQRAVVKGMQLYAGDLAVAKFLDYDDPKSIVYGYLLTQEDEQEFKDILAVFDDTNGYSSDPKTCWYLRSITTAYILND